MLSRLFSRATKIIEPKIIQPTLKKDLSHFFSTSSASKSKIPPFLERFIGHDEAAKGHYLAYVDYFEKAKEMWGKKENYPLAIEYLEQARHELEETTDLSNLTMSLFRQINDLAGQIQSEMPSGKKSHSNA